MSSIRSVSPESHVDGGHAAKRSRLCSSCDHLTAILRRVVLALYEQQQQQQQQQ